MLDFLQNRIFKLKWRKISSVDITIETPVDNNNSQDTDTTPTDYTTYPERQKHEKIFRQIFELILDDALFEGIRRERPVLEFKQPTELEKIVDLQLGKKPVKNHDQLVKLAKQVIKYSVKVGNPHFINQLYSGVDPYGVCAEWIASSLNGSVYTYEVGPLFTMMELEVFERMRNIIGFPKNQGDGLFCSGGFIANGYAISCARYKKRPEIKEKGLFGMKPMVMFVSEDAHYSFKKLASFQGIGMENVIGIKVDGRGKLIPAELEKAIQF